ncbi:MAG: hypothetical protein AB7K24_02630 [Gemmataceae bacterium]
MVPSAGLPILDLSEDVVSEPARKLLRLLLLLAFKDKASELHFVPEQAEFRMTFKQAGQFHDMIPPPSYLGHEMVQILTRASSSGLSFIQLQVKSATVKALLSIRPGWFGHQAILLLFPPYEAASSTAALLLDESLTKNSENLIVDFSESSIAL